MAKVVGGSGVASRHTRVKLVSSAISNDDTLSLDPELTITNLDTNRLYLVRASLLFGNVNSTAGMKFCLAPSSNFEDSICVGWAEYSQTNGAPNYRGNFTYQAVDDVHSLELGSSIEFHVQLELVLTPYVPNTSADIGIWWAQYAASEATALYLRPGSMLEVLELTAPNGTYVEE